MVSVKKSTVMPTCWKDLEDECRRVLSDVHTAVFRAGDARVCVWTVDGEYRVTADRYDGLDIEAPDAKGATWAVTKFLSSSWSPGDDAIEIEHTVPEKVL